MRDSDRKLSIVSNEFPDPPYPADTRAKGLMFDIDVERLYQSKTWLIAPSDLKPWLLRLWIESWRSIPVGSFEDDDELIAARIQMPEVLFQAHRKVLLRCWRKHADGRLYHPTITERVLKLISWREKERLRKQSYREMQAEMSHGTDTGRTWDSAGKTRCPSTTSSSSSSSAPAESRANALVDSAAQQPPDSPVMQVFAHWQDTMKHPRAQLDRKRKVAIASRLKDGYSVDELKAAVDGCKASDWHQGKNKNGKVYDDIELICRNASHVDQFRAELTKRRTDQAELDAWINDEADRGSFIEGDFRHV